METDRIASWLFDSDPESSVAFVADAPFAQVPLLRVQLERVDVVRPATVLAEVQGRWTGAIYIRNFATPNDKPYIFLGRHRVLVAASTPLATRVREMAEGGRRVALSELIADLKEDEAGYPSALVADLLG